MSATLMILQKTSNGYLKHFNQTIMAWPEWRVFDYIVPPLHNASSAQCWIRFNGTGIVDVDDIKFEYVSKEQLDQSNPKKIGNLLPTSSFPTGLNGKWSLSRDSRNQGSKVFSDPNETGPTGLPALKLQPGNIVLLYSPAFEANPLRKHTLSLYAKGSVPGQKIRMALFYGKDQRVSIPITLNTTWKRYSQTIEFPFPINDIYNVAIHSTKPSWIDGLMVEESDTCNDFQRSGKVEVALSQKTNYGLHFDDEPLSVKMAVYGDTQPGMEVKGFLRDMVGNKVPVGPFSIKDGKLQITDLKLPRDPKSGFGTFNLELQAYDKTGKPVSKWSELVLHRVRKPRMWSKDAPDSPFGIHINPTPEQAKMAKMLGFNWVRTHDAAQECTKWYFLEKTPGKLDYTDADRKVNIFRSNNLMILGLLDTCPKWYSGWIPECKNAYNTRYFLPREEHMDMWREYCRNAVSHFKGRIDRWEVYNEPYCGYGFFIKKAELVDEKVKIIGGSPADYTTGIKIAYEEAKIVNPSCTVIWMDYPGSWHERAVKAGVYQYCDEISFHGYNALKAYAFEDFGEILNELKKGLPADKKNVKFNDTEAGVGGANFFNISRNYPPFNQLENTKLASSALVRGELGAIVGSVKQFYVYSFHGWTWAPNYMLMTSDGNLAPLATAISNLAWHIEGKKYVGKKMITDTYFALLFEGNEESTVVFLASGTPKKPYVFQTLPEGIAARDLYGNDLQLPFTYTLDNDVLYFTAPNTKAEDIAKKVFDK
jgi:hypothetical protein